MHPIRSRVLAGALAASTAIASSIAFADDDISQLKEQLEKLDQKIRVLERIPLSTDRRRSRNA